MRTDRFVVALCGVLACLVFTGAAFLRGQAPAPAGTQTPTVPPAPAGGRGGGTPGTETGWSTFQTQCAGCHGVVTPIGDAPMVSAIREMTPERINAALQGKDHHGRKLTDIQAAVRFELKELDGLIQSVVPNTSGITRAHLEDLRHRIDEALKGKLATGQATTT